MPGQSEWSIAAPQKLTFEEPVTALKVSVAGGTVNVVGTGSGPARLELSDIDGPPLAVSLDGGALTVGYDDLPKNVLKWLDRATWKRRVTVTLTVPAATRVEIAVVGADAVVSGISGPTDLKGVSGDTTLVGVTGTVRADTVSGRFEAQALAGDLRFHSVSGDLTLVESGGGTVHAESVSGDMLVDLAAGAAVSSPSLTLTSVSGEVAVRLPHPRDARVDAEVDAGTTTGPVSCAFEDLRVSGQWGAKRITGTLGAGSGDKAGGRLKVTTVSGGVALLRRPPAQDTAADSAPHGKVL
ncbi:DUF4097 family beta strand repeat-containing protein [Streptomyces cinnamoneus]|uniref:DUF4097 domain-containing protein n=1 Tax=Streptomyces cinnamoneus TaxID=53446 RepID=A0A918TVC6_STRCJ|nr:DUF4097 family beta strand repeat-containing protein [Streptomyces cinnamoneus]GHC60574.1 hypothetical protein GCM10010507_41950 [Streptomyces cinnamoneus]